jgi:hypothetical protein
MVTPFPSTDAPTETRLDNLPTFDDLDRLSLGEIADMPPDCCWHFRRRQRLRPPGSSA